MRKQYLADGVYADFRPGTSLNGDIIILTTENGTELPSNVIYMDETVMLAFDQWRRRLKEDEQLAEANA